METKNTDIKKHCVVFGGTSTIAVAIARALAHEGYKLSLVGRDAKALAAVKDDLIARGAEVEFYTQDLKNLENLNSLIEKIESILGKISGVLIAHGSLTDQKRAEDDLVYFKDEFELNFLSPAIITLKFAKKFEESVSVENKIQKFIIGISSVAGDRGRMSNYVYGSAKSAFNELLSGVRNRLSSKNVHVITVKPGFIRSKMTEHLPQGILFKEPEVVAKDVIKALEGRGFFGMSRDVVYTPWFWRCIMLAIRNIPERFFKRMKL